jgi:predicted nicotinamide N-methyase
VNAPATSPGYQTRQQSIAITGTSDLIIRSLLNGQQFHDPRGDAERLGISSASWPLFGMLWPSSAHLAARIATRTVAHGERMLEIGCGLALASLVAHRRGADITASDCHPLAAQFLKINLRLNGLTPMKYRYGHWGDVASPPARNGTTALRRVCGSYDLLIGSDVLYERDDDGALSRFVARHAAAHAEVWIIDPNRSNRSAFNQRMHNAGFILTEENIDTAATEAAVRYRGRMLTYCRR